MAAIKSVLTQGAVVLAALAMAGSAVAQTDHLTCFKAKDSQRFHARAVLDGPQDAFDAGECRIIGKAKMFCVPQQKTVTEYLVDDAPRTLLEVTGPEPVPDRICYKVKCPRAELAPAEVSDQFGNRELSKFKVTLVCTPAVKGPPPTTTTTSTTSTTTTTLIEKVVFVTSTTHRGDFGGLAAADAECSARASAAGLSGTFLAWLAVGDPNTDPESRFTRHFGGPYVRTDGLSVANDWTDLVDGRLRKAIDRTESGVQVPANTRVWTGVGVDGRRAFLHCAGWTDGAEAGVWGFATRSDDLWSEASWTACNAQFRLYCFEQ